VKSNGREVSINQGENAITLDAGYDWQEDWLSEPEE
jgi:hypothetical protein